MVLVKLKPSFTAATHGSVDDIAVAVDDDGKSIMRAGCRLFQPLNVHRRSISSSTVRKHSYRWTRPHRSRSLATNANVEQRREPAIHPSLLCPGHTCGISPCRMPLAAPTLPYNGEFPGERQNSPFYGKIALTQSDWVCALFLSCRAGDGPMSRRRVQRRRRAMATLGRRYLSVLSCRSQRRRKRRR